MTAATSPLSGITVLALEQAIADQAGSGRVPALGEDTDAIRAEVGEPG